MTVLSPQHRDPRRCSRGVGAVSRPRRHTVLSTTHRCKKLARAVRYLSRGQKLDARVFHACRTGWLQRATPALLRGHELSHLSVIQALQHGAKTAHIGGRYLPLLTGTIIAPRPSRVICRQDVDETAQKWARITIFHRRGRSRCGLAQEHWTKFATRLRMPGVAARPTWRTHRASTG